MLMGFMAFILKVLTKMDLVTDKHRKAELQSYLNPDPEYILKVLDGRSTPKQHKLNAAIASLIEDFSLVSFVPMDRGMRTLSAWCCSKWTTACSTVKMKK